MCGCYVILSKLYVCVLNKVGLCQQMPPVTRGGHPNGGNDDDVPNAPPLPQNLADAVTALINATAGNTRFLHELAENMNAMARMIHQQNQNNQQQPNHGRRNNIGGETTYVDFTDTRPPVFSKADEPLEADDWLRTMEQKFSLLRCTETQKPLFAAQQLRGAATSWWTNLVAV